MTPMGGSGVKVILEYGSSLGFLYSKDVLSVEFILQKYLKTNSIGPFTEIWKGTKLERYQI